MSRKNKILCHEDEPKSKKMCHEIEPNPPIIELCVRKINLSFKMDL
jgi:hypothetical protein